MKILHAGMVVPECYKDDSASQLKGGNSILAIPGKSPSSRLRRWTTSTAIIVLASDQLP